MGSEIDSPAAVAAGEQPSTALTRVFFIPFFATGHMIPLVDIAHLFASRGVDSTILVTPSNADKISATVELAAVRGLPLHVITYPFPSDEVGLPDGQENLADVAPSDSEKIDAASPLTAPHHDRLLRLHRPDAVVSDTHFAWTTAIAKELGIPRITFHAIGLFPSCVMNSLIFRTPHHAVSGDDEPFLVPGLPDPIYMVRSELPDFLRHNTILAGVLDAIFEAESGSLGAVINSFDAIEAPYAEYYQKDGKMKSWLVGPVALAAGGDVASRGGRAGSNRAACLNWLDRKPDGSVLYAAFGSWCDFSDEQLRELALGLEESGHSFLWVVRNNGEEDLTWLPEGFEKRVAERGLVVRGWAPQVAVLDHVAVGGFLTHCGWNSVLEGLTAGLPMVTWPLSTEQFINEKLVETVLGTAVRASDGPRSTDVAEKRVVPASHVAEAVRRVMGGGEEAERRRRRAKGYGEAARAAVAEGGSSNVGLTRLIEDIEASRKQRTPAL